MKCDYLAHFWNIQTSKYNRFAEVVTECVVNANCCKPFNIIKNDTTIKIKPIAYLIWSATVSCEYYSKLIDVDRWIMIKLLFHQVVELKCW